MVITVLFSAVTLAFEVKIIAPKGVEVIYPRRKADHKGNCGNKINNSKNKTDCCNNKEDLRRSAGNKPNKQFIPKRDSYYTADNVTSTCI